MINNAIYVNSQNVLIPCADCFNSHEYILFTNEEYDTHEFITAYDMVFRPASGLIKNVCYDEKVTDNTVIEHYKNIIMLRRETGV